MPERTFRIGVIAEKLGRKRNTIHRWEHDGVIAESMGRSGEKVAHRAYTQAEIQLIGVSFNRWQKEHKREVGKGVPKPSMFRFGQIYWDLRQFLIKNGSDYFFDLPNGHLYPERLDFDPCTEIFQGEETYYGAIVRVNGSIRGCDQMRRAGMRVATRLRFLESVYRSSSKAVMSQIIHEYEEKVKHAENQEV